MKRVILMLVILAVIGAAAAGWFAYDKANRDFSPWMSEQMLAIYLQQFETAKPGGPDWGKSHWFTAVEGRWNDGTAEYRIRYAAPPANTPFAWHYLINMDQATFSKSIQEYGDGGYKLVYDHSYKLPDGTLRYQGVWHKVGSDK